MRTSPEEEIMRKINFASALAVRCNVDQLPHDLQRMLRLQLKEFIHHLDDCEYLKTDSYLTRSICKLIFLTS
jgi:hypothetical protein